MAESNADILRSGYDAFAAGDIPAVLAIFSEDITWRVFGDNPLSGVYNGHDEVLGFFQALMDRSGGTFKIDIDEILVSAEEDKVAVLVSEEAERRGERRHFEAVHLWTLEDGRATHFQGMAKDQRAWDEFWSD